MTANGAAWAPRFGTASHQWKEKRPKKVPADRESYGGENDTDEQMYRDNIVDLLLCDSDISAHMNCCSMRIVPYCENARKLAGVAGAASTKVRKDIAKVDTATHKQRGHAADGTLH